MSRSQSVLVAVFFLVLSFLGGCALRILLPPIQLRRPTPERYSCCFRSRMLMLIRMENLSQAKANPSLILQLTTSLKLERDGSLR